MEPDPGTGRRWLEQRTLNLESVDVPRLLRRKSELGTKITVCLPARDEEATVGAICAALRRDLLEVGVIDQLVVIDSRSTDSTAAAARSSGAEVHSVEDILPGIPGFDGGKGEALWKSLAVARGDLIAWADADTRNFTSDFVLQLLQPLLDDPELVFVKGFYERPIAQGDRLVQSGGARVTELLARPVLNLFYPDLSGVIQPLSGEYAIRTEVARSVPFMSGYSPDIGLLLWVAEMYGLDRMVQVDLGTRIHRNQDIPSLGRMAHQVLQGMLHVLDGFGRVKLVDDLPTTLTQFISPDGLSTSETFDLPVVELPRMRSVDER